MFNKVEVDFITQPGTCWRMHHAMFIHLDILDQAMLLRGVRQQHFKQL